MKEKCDRFTFEEINLFVDNEMENEKVEYFKAHYPTCSACSRKVEQIKAISSVFRNRVDQDLAGIDMADFNFQNSRSGSLKKIYQGRVQQSGNFLSFWRKDPFKQNNPGLPRGGYLGNIPGLFWKNISLKLGAITAIVIAGLIFFNTEILHPSGPSAIVSTVDARTSSVMIIETQKHKHTIIWFTET